MTLLTYQSGHNYILKIVVYYITCRLSFTCGEMRIHSPSNLSVGDKKVSFPLYFHHDNGSMQVKRHMERACSLILSMSDVTELIVKGIERDIQTIPSLSTCRPTVCMCVSHLLILLSYTIYNILYILMLCDSIPACLPATSLTGGKQTWRDMHTHHDSKHPYNIVCPARLDLFGFISAL